MYIKSLQVPQLVCKSKRKCFQEQKGTYGIYSQEERGAIESQAVGVSCLLHQ